MRQKANLSLASILYFTGAIVLALYFAFTAVQGDYGVFRRAEINADIRAAELELASVEAELAKIDNLTRRLSDDYLDVDLLDERARDILGQMRADEIVLR